MLNKNVFGYGPSSRISKNIFVDFYIPPKKI